MALAIPMPVKLDGIFNKAGLAHLSCALQNDADTSAHQLQKRKFETVRNQLPMRRQKRFRFHPSVKKHDGISTTNTHLERMLFDFWKIRT